MAYPPKRGSFAVHKTPGVVSIRGKQKPGYVVVSTWMPPSSDSTYHIQMVWTKSGQFPVGYEVLTTRGRVVGGLFSKASAAVAAAKRDALDTFKNPASVIPRTWIPARVRRLKSGQVQVAVGGRGRR